jgi:hypothetical protein
MSTEDDELDGYKFQRGGHWEPEYIQTILQWIHICAINVDIMTESAAHYRKLLRRQTIISLLLTSLASTSSLSQFGINVESNATLKFALNVAFTVMSFMVALSTGYIKVYQVQEKLEQSIKLQQEWTALGSVLSSELQLPIPLRKDALLIIVKYKDVYLELFKQQTDTSMAIMNRIAKKYGLESYADLSLSELFERILWLERRRILGTDEKGDASSHQIDTMPTIPVKRNQVAPEGQEAKESQEGKEGQEEAIDKFLMMVKLKSKQMPTPELNERRKKISQMVMDQSASDTFRGNSAQRRPTISSAIRAQLSEFVEAGVTPLLPLSHVRLPPIHAPHMGIVHGKPVPAPRYEKAQRISRSLQRKEEIQKEMQDLEVTPIPTPERAERIEELQHVMQHLDNIIEIEEAVSRDSEGGEEQEQEQQTV